MQPLGLYAANSIFIGDYLTTPGQAARADYEMIRDAGFVLEAPDGTALDAGRLDELLAGETAPVPVG
jgi:biotin synthase